MLIVWPPPIDSPAIARSSAFVETLKLFSTIGITSSSRSCANERQRARAGSAGRIGRIGAGGAAAFAGPA